MQVNINMNVLGLVRYVEKVVTALSIASVPILANTLTFPVQEMDSLKLTVLVSKHVNIHNLLVLKVSKHELSLLMSCDCDV